MIPDCAVIMVIGGRPMAGTSRALSTRPSLADRENDMSISRTNALAFGTAALILSLAATPTLASAWPQPEGQGILINTFAFQQTQNHAGTPNPAFGNGTFREYGVAPYFEYGLTDRVTIGAAANLQLRTLTPGSANGGPGDIDLFVRPTVWRNDNWAIAVQGLVKVPTGYNPNANPALGDDQVDLEPRLLVGRGFSFGSWPAFADVSVAYRYRFGSPADEVRIDGTVGVHLRDDWMVLIQSYNIIGLQNQAPGGTNFSLSTLAASVVHDLSRSLSVQAGAFSEVASRNYNKGSGVLLAIWWRF